MKKMQLLGYPTLIPVKDLKKKQEKIF